MRTSPDLRKRYGSQPVAGLGRIMSGVFGMGSPASQLSSPAQVEGENGPGAFYAFHEGDLFQPGTGNWVFEPSLETPLNTIWGHAFLRTPNTFNPVQPPQIYSNPNITVNGLGGPIAGQIIFQPLIDPTTAPEQGA